MTVQGVDGSGGTARGLRCVTKATRKMDAIQVKVSVAEEVGGGCCQKQSSCGQSGLTLIGEGVRHHLDGCRVF